MSEANVSETKATLNGKEVGLRIIDGQLQLDRPIFAMNRPAPVDMSNLVSLKGDLNDITIRYKSEVKRFVWGISD